MVDLSIAMLVHQRVDQLSYGFDAGGRITLLVASILNCRAPVESAPYPVREFPILAQYLWMNCVNWIGNVGISMDVLLLSYCIPYFCMFPQSISFGIYVCQLSKLVERKDLQEPPHGFLRLSWYGYESKPWYRIPGFCTAKQLVNLDVYPQKYLGSW